MKISPDLSEVKRIAATGQYNVLPVSMEILSDFTTPIETMKILKNVSTHCYMLESGNVRAAIRTLHPFAVDVSSGIETDGVKDKTKMTAFVAAVRKEEER